MKDNKPTYDIIEGTGSTKELGRYKACFDENDSEKNLETLKWFHQDNLRRKQSIIYAVEPENQEIAAIYTYLPVTLICKNKYIDGLQSFDTLTDHRHRGKGLFIRLARALANKEAQLGNELVFGFPNENSVNGFVKKLGFTYFGEVPFLIKPLRITYFIKKVAKRHTEVESSDIELPMQAAAEVPLSGLASLKQIDHFGEAFDELWEKIKENITIGVNRDSAYMNWRFIQKPGTRYLRYGYYEGSSLKGVIVFILKNKHGGRIGYLMEMLYDPGCKKAPKELLRFASRVLKQHQADVILAWCYKHSFNYDAYKRGGFFNFPEKIRPQKLGVIVKILQSSFEKEILHKKNWYISYSDSDTI